jgi:hypothetical protein
MATQIIDNGATIKIVNNGNILLVTKHQIKTIDTIRNNTVRIDIGGGPLHNIFIKSDEVSEPAIVDNLGLRDYINGLLIGGVNGTATESNQVLEIKLLEKIQKGIADLVGIIRNNSGASTIRKPIRIDESEAGVIYYGYAALGSDPSMPVWAIEKATINRDIIVYNWAGGTENYDKIWEERFALIYG